MAIRTVLVFEGPDGLWTRDYPMPIPPHPGLGIRLDVYEVMNVDAVSDGAPGADCVCRVSFDPPASDAFDAKHLRRLGFAFDPPNADQLQVGRRAAGPPPALIEKAEPPFRTLLVTFSETRPGRPRSPPPPRSRRASASRSRTPRLSRSRRRSSEIGAST